MYGVQSSTVCLDSSRRDATTLAPAVAVSFGCLKPRAFASRCASFCFVTELQSRSRALRWQRSRVGGYTPLVFAFSSRRISSHLISSSITSRSSKGSNCAQLRIAAQRTALRVSISSPPRGSCDAMRCDGCSSGAAPHRIASQREFEFEYSNARCTHTVLTVVVVCSAAQRRSGGEQSRAERAEAESDAMRCVGVCVGVGWIASRRSARIILFSRVVVCRGRAAGRAAFAPPRRV